MYMTRPLDPKPQTLYSKETPNPLNPIIVPLRIPYRNPYRSFKGPLKPFRMDLDIPRELRVLHPRGQVRSRQSEAELTVTIRAWGFGFGV